MPQEGYANTVTTTDDSVCSMLEFAVLFGLPMRPEEIETHANNESAEDCSCHTG